MSLASAVWRAAATALSPLLPLHLALRARRGREIADRLPERRGRAADRPPGRLFWLHAASVGELMSVLPVLAAMGERDRSLQVLVTTGTVTSAALLADRVPPVLAGRLRHRFVPLDVPRWVDRFLDGWRPDAGAFVDSELWPNLLAAAASRAVPLALVNARMSPRSAARWRRMPGLARQVLGSFRLVIPRSAEDAALYAALGAPVASAPGDLKAGAPPLPADPAMLAALGAAIAGRPMVLAASTHPGEDGVVFAAHRELVGTFPGLLTIIVPRHPHRGPAIAAEAEAAGLSAGLRSAGRLPEPSLDAYVADTVGELGLFYRLANAAIVGGSLVPHGGQNPLEPARLGCPILFGPHMWNFVEPVARLLEAGGAVQVEGAAALAPALRAVLSDRERARALTGAAAAVADLQAGLPDRVAGALLGLLPPGQPADATGPRRLAGPVTNEV